MPGRTIVDLQWKETPCQPPTLPLVMTNSPSVSGASRTVVETPSARPPAPRSARMFVRLGDHRFAPPEWIYRGTSSAGPVSIRTQRFADPDTGSLNTRTPAAFIKVPERITPAPRFRYTPCEPGPPKDREAWDRSPTSVPFTPRPDVPCPPLNRVQSNGGPRRERRLPRPSKTLGVPPDREAYREAGRGKRQIRPHDVCPPMVDVQARHTGLKSFQGRG